jgi:DNA-binding transcriptional regulator YdaS (Cro superfamily)
VADSFLGRWSQRKQAVREGKPLAEPAVVAQPLTQPQEAGHDAKAPSAVTAIAPLTEGQVATKEVPPALSLQDVQQLTAQSDFAPFVARDVAPDVRNAAMKKLFTDPHYNVMDGLDIYIDDYSKPDPLPESMLRQMASAKFLNLFEDEEEASPDQPTPNPAPEPALDHDHPDLRLQPHHAAGPQEPGRGTE